MAASSRRLASTLHVRPPQQSAHLPPPLPSAVARRKPRPKVPGPDFKPPISHNEITIHPVFDIFDAPAHLHEHRLFLKKSVKLPPPPLGTTTELGSVMQRRPPPSKSLLMPSPTLFDGPAKPRLDSLPEWHRPRLSTPTLSSKPLTGGTTHGTVPAPGVIQVFDGPARISRYHHQSDSSHHKTDAQERTKWLVMIAAAAGSTAVAVSEYMGYGRRADG
ncbi:hypothetical protein MD484_g698, partial [Candolleomyces efflorescens]